MTKLNIRFFSKPKLQGIRLKRNFGSKFTSFSLLAMFFLLQSCVPTKRLEYLQHGESGNREFDLKRSDYKVQRNDILNISIRTFDPETANYFNLTNVNQNNMFQGGDILFYLQGYTVDYTGNIQLPILGDVYVENLDINEIQELIEKELTAFFTDEATFVTVQLAGIRFSIVGEVNMPGKYVLYQNQVNIFEALASAGDISMVGDRKEVMVIRQDSNGVHTYELDLTDAEVLAEENFFIQPNDIINVKPLPQKSLGIGTTGFQTFTQIFSVAVSAITLVIAINSLSNS
ncbi:MAG: polysaccharide biosynthesis/export family protein [Bacteroidetes bacterium]|nr:polysaccharide biosynthesis/export family protein [Bacteroidota bacterium]